MRLYRLIDHTADFGLEIFGSDARALFTNAAEALFDIITDAERIEPKEKRSIRVSGADWPDLMVNWYRELLNIWNVKKRLVKSVFISQISERKLTAESLCQPYIPDHHIIKIEIKAVTYHQIQVVPKPEGWKARIILDV